MATLHIENTVRDYDEWKVNFDKFHQLRQDKGVRAYRVARHHADPNKLMIDLDFDTVAVAEDFCDVLAKIWRSPQAQRELVSHTEPLIVDVVEERTL